MELKIWYGRWPNSTAVERPNSTAVESPEMIVHFVFNTTVSSNPGELKDFSEVLVMDDNREKEQGYKSLSNEVMNFVS